MGKSVLIAAEALWQAESLRAADRKRTEPWSEQDEKLREKWCYMASAAINALMDAGYGIIPPPPSPSKTGKPATAEAGKTWKS